MQILSFSGWLHGAPELGYWNPGLASFVKNDMLMGTSGWSLSDDQVQMARRMKAAGNAGVGDRATADGVRGRTGTRVDQNPGGPHRPARLRVGGVFRPTQTYRRVEEDRPPGITPRPGDGCLGDFTLPLEQSNPGRAQAPGPNPGAGRLPVPAVPTAPGTRRLWKQGVGTPDPGPGPIVPARNRGRTGPNPPRAPELPGSAPDALLREPGAISTRIKAPGEWASPHPD